MKDLYSGLIKPGLRPDLEPHQFYGKYKYLNSTVIPSDVTLFKIQLQQLRLVEKTKNKKYINTEKFLKQAKTDLLTIEDDIYNASEEKIYTRIIELLNAGLWGNVEMNPTRRLKDELINRKQRDDEVKKIVNEMKFLLSQLKVNEPLNEKVLNILETRIAKQSGNNKEYTNTKAELAEMLAAEMLNKNPGFQAIVSGKLRDSLGQQLIEDIFVFNKKTIGAFFGSLSFQVIRNKNKETFYATSIQDLFNQINSLSGNYTINLSDELYDVLKKASELDAQVKSGRDIQAIINRNMRNAMTLDGFSPYLLIELYKEQKEKDQYFLPENQQHSEDLNSLANFHLSKKISRSALTSNQLYFTTHGISTASMWMEQNNYILKFYPGVYSVGQNFLTKKYQYQLRSLNNN